MFPPLQTGYGPVKVPNIIYHKSCLRKGDRLFVHIMSLSDNSLFLPVKAKVRKALDYETKKPLRFTQTEDGVLVHLGQVPQVVDHIVELQTK